MACNLDYLSDTEDDKNTYGGKIMYTLEHLATFTVSEETGILTPLDGMKRLLQLEKSNGIWSQKMQICVDKKSILVLDYETETIMEQFPAHLIQEPTAFKRNDTMEIYNNILVFIIGGSVNSKIIQSEMHIFQCHNVPAQKLCEYLKVLKSGKLITSPLSNDCYNRFESPVNFKNSEADIFERRPNNFALDNDGDDMKSVSDTNNGEEEIGSTTSDKYEKDVAILNSCFDDIEKFISRLQHAAAASRELERRKRNRKSKSKDFGDGMLTMRMKPPNEKEYYEILQKFKYSFNLLAKLKSQIHDPNAPELVHFLFTPLALIINAAHETCPNPNIASKVESPLLTREAINLLMNCVTSKEMELWHSLGNAWLIPRDQWTGAPVRAVEQYQLPYWNRLSDHHESPVRHDYDFNAGYQNHNHNNEFLEYEQLTNDTMCNNNANSDISTDSMERHSFEDKLLFQSQQEQWLDELKSKKAIIVQVTYPRTANNDKELTVCRGEYLDVLDDTRKWWKVQNNKGIIAHVPNTIITLYTEDSHKEFDHNNVDQFKSSQQIKTRLSGSSEKIPSVITTASADWIRKERLGKKGEFRYF